MIRATSERAEHQERRARLDPLRPQAWFLEGERTAGGDIVRVATVLLTNHECPWRCVFCDLWKSTTLERVPVGAIPAQIDFALAQARDPAVRALKLYNSGSFFDPNAIPSEDFPAIAERAARFDRVIVECHPALVNGAVLRFAELLRAAALAREGQCTLEIAMGLEIASDEILARLGKRMTLATFRRAADFCREHGIEVRAFVIVKPPFVRTEEEAVLWAARSVEFAFDCGATAVSLIPARFGPAALHELATKGDFAPPKLATLEAALDHGMALGRGRVFADLWDLEKFSHGAHDFPARYARLARMNLEQVVLSRIPCPTTP